MTSVFLKNHFAEETYQLFPFRTSSIVFFLGSHLLFVYDYIYFNPKQTIFWLSPSSFGCHLQVPIVVSIILYSIAGLVLASTVDSIIYRWLTACTAVCTVLGVSVDVWFTPRTTNWKQLKPSEGGGSEVEVVAIVVRFALSLWLLQIVRQD